MIPNIFSSITEHHSINVENRVSSGIARHVITSKLVPFSIWISFERFWQIFSLFFIDFYSLFSIVALSCSYFSRDIAKEVANHTNIHKKIQWDIERNVHKLSIYCSISRFIIEQFSLCLKNSEILEYNSTSLQAKNYRVALGKNY